MIIWESICCHLVGFIVLGDNFSDEIMIGTTLSTSTFKRVLCCKVKWSEVWHETDKGEEMTIFVIYLKWWSSIRWFSQIWLHTRYEIEIKTKSLYILEVDFKIWQNLSYFFRLRIPKHFLGPCRAQFGQVRGVREYGTCYLACNVTVGTCMLWPITWGNFSKSFTITMEINLKVRVWGIEAMRNP